MSNSRAQNPKGGGGKLAVAREVWSQMFQVLMRTAPYRAKSLGSRGLTPNDSRALSALDRERGQSMRSLAMQWDCDASNATWVVDRLEKLGLAERRPDSNDRRVKMVVLTAKGEKTKSELMEEFLVPPDELLDLSREELAALRSLLAKVSVPLKPKD
jgi:DNA-binding MarR family transcriptional regulator